MGTEMTWQKQLIAAIPLRHSVRAYKAEALPAELVEQIERFFQQLEMPFIHQTKMLFFQAEPDSHVYNNGANPPDNAAFLSQTDAVSLAKTGFVGELVMLYAVSLGLDTCWYGHYTLAEVGKYIEGIATIERLAESPTGFGYGRHDDVGERVVVCTPFGYKQDDLDMIDERLRNRPPASRLPLSELLENPSIITSIPNDIMTLLELARQAPSGGNAQMWRFGLQLDHGIITVAKPHGYEHPRWEHPDVDIGICAAHLWLGLAANAYDPEVSVELDGDRALWTFKIKLADLF